MGITATLIEKNLIGAQFEEITIRMYCTVQSIDIEFNLLKSLDSKVD
jgi:hypothetical protein